MEKRKSTRFELQFPVTITHPLLPAIPFSGKATNVSFSGMQITSSIPLTVGDSLTLAFRLDNKQYYDLTSTVRWRTIEGARVNSYRAGIEFEMPLDAAFPNV